MKQIEFSESNCVQLDQNKEIVKQYVSAFNRGDMEALRSLFAEDATIQGVFGLAPLEKAFEVWKQLISGLNMKLIIEEIIAEGEHIAVRYTEKGVFKGSFMGHSPTGKSYEIKAMEWFIIKDGKIKQRYGARDHFSQAKQIGLPLS